MCQFLLVNLISNSFLFNTFLFTTNLMENLNVNTMMNFVNFLGYATKIPMLIPEYYNQEVDHTEDYLNVIDEDL